MKVLWDFLSFLYWGFRFQVEAGRLSYELFILAHVKYLPFLTNVSTIRISTVANYVFL